MRLYHRIPGLARVTNLPSFPGGVSLSAIVAAIVASGTTAVWLDPSDLTTLFQDDAGTTLRVNGAGVSVYDSQGTGNYLTYPCISGCVVEPCYPSTAVSTA